MCVCGCVCKFVWCRCVSDACKMFVLWWSQTRFENEPPASEQKLHSNDKLLIWISNVKRRSPNLQKFVCSLLWRRLSFQVWGQTLSTVYCQITTRFGTRLANYIVKPTHSTSNNAKDMCFRRSKPTVIDKIHNVISRRGTIVCKTHGKLNP
jgi:hypothetical protein